MATTASAYLSTYPNNEMSPTDFSLLMDAISLNAKGKLSGVAVTNKNVYVSGNGTLAVAAGWCAVRGRIVRINAGDVDVPLAGSGTQTKYLVLVLNLASESNNAELQVLNSVPSDSAGFNASNGLAYLRLASMTVGTSTINSVSSDGILNLASIIASKTSLVTATSVLPVIKGTFSSQTKSQDNVTININTTSPEYTINIARSGYTAIGIGGFFLANASSSGQGAGSCYFARCYLTKGVGSTTVSYIIRNLNTTKKAKVKVSVIVTYVKNS